MTTTATPRRRTLDAHRSKSRVRLGSCLQTWAHLKEQLGFSLHSQLAQHLLESYFSKVCVRCSAGEGKGGTPGVMSTSRESLQELVLLIHRHGQTCPSLPLPCFITHTSPTVETSELGDSSEVRIQYTCERGHQILWSPDGIPDNEQTKPCTNEAQISTSHLKLRVQKRLETSGVGVKRREMMTRGKTKDKRQQNRDVAHSPTKQGTRSESFGEMKNMVTDVAQHVAQQIGNDETTDLPLADHEAPRVSPEPSSDHHTEEQSSPASNEKVAVLNAATRGTQRREDQTAQKSEQDSSSKTISPQSLKDGVYRTGDKRKRRPTQKVLLSCEFDGCDKIFSSRQYLNHHVKYQHLQQKTFTCSHSTCKKSFNFKKHLKEHEKSHSDQRDFICEFCARAFRTNSNLIIHRRIHTGEKPLQCEVCGFTCRQKASLNWHMRKHNAQSAYQFPCEICGRRFEKRDNVTAHRSKSHPDHSVHTTEDPNKSHPDHSVHTTEDPNKSHPDHSVHTTEDPNKSQPDHSVHTTEDPNKSHPDRSVHTTEDPSKSHPDHSVHTTEDPNSISSPSDSA